MASKASPSLTGRFAAELMKRSGSHLMGAGSAWMVFRFSRFSKDLSLSGQNLGPQSYPSPAWSRAEGDVVPVLRWEMLTGELLLRIQHDKTTCLWSIQLAALLFWG